MSALYGSLRGCRQTITRTGSRNSGMKASLQSFDGSLIGYLDYDQNNNLKVRIELAEGSTTYGDVAFSGTFEELKESMKLLQEIKEGKVSITRHREKSNKQLALERAFAEVK